MADRAPGIRVEGLREFRSSLKGADAATTKIINQELRVSAETVAAAARGLAPRKTGRLAGSLKPFAAGNRVGVRSSLPYANVQHWGGTTGRGHTSSRPGATRVRGTQFVTRAVEGREDQIIQGLGEALERALVRIAND